MNLNQYTENEFLGSGSFSNVYKVTLDNKLYALKKIHPYLLKDSFAKSAILKQIQIMKQIDHPNIIKFYDHILNGQNQINLLLEYAEGGNLYNQLKIHQKLSQGCTIKYLKEIIEAIKYLHSRPQPILHRDIKPQNILLTKNGQCKLADFGSSNILDQQRYTFAGTKQYMAPQIIECKPYGKQIDLWCLGILIYEMLTGSVPKQGNILNLPTILSRPAEDVIKKLLEKDPKFRMTLEELENHSWFINENKLLQNTLSLGKNQRTQFFTQNKNIVSRILSLHTKKLNTKRLQVIKQKKTKSIEIEMKQQKQNSQQQKCGKQVIDNFKKQIELIKLKNDLKIKLNKSRNIVIQVLEIYQTSKRQKLQEIFRIEQKIKQYKDNILLLITKYPLKFQYQYSFIAKQFIKKVDNLSQYVQYFPIKLHEQVQLPQINNKINFNISADELILKLKNYTIQCQKNVLMETIKAKKKNIMLREMNKR